MTLVELADIREVHFGHQKSPWQVRCCHHWITRLYLGLIQKCCFTTAKRNHKNNPQKGQVWILHCWNTNDKALTLPHIKPSSVPIHRDTIPLLVEHRQFAHSGAASDMGQLSPPALPGCALGLEPSQQWQLLQGFSALVHLNGLQYQAWRRSIYFLSPARGIFAFKLENNLLFLALALIL